MNPFAITTVLVIGLLLPLVAPGQEPGMYYYKGVWVDQLSNGPMSADIEKLDGDKWKAKFNGTWQGQPFTYEIEFTGPAGDLRGQQKINGVTYQWSSSLTPKEFIGRYRSNRSGDGSWKMARH